ncbi:HEAT repeat-containing protein [Nocardioides scoriae]|uniref:HEAT repeat-containing protein n=1 Tax=Nocardioides scoriae TaxID=642780 RepID=A0A1H1XXY2_9ACTN|nr:HEAT repeat domain-containing protein [Nocardioides scoriae]SDT14100.1 HEAT repeat-containing protein [Nocardioides scoriae]
MPGSVPDTGGFLRLSWWLLVVFVVLAVVVFVLLVVIRAVRDVVADRRTRAADLTRLQIFDLVMGEAEESGAAAQQLGALRGREQDRVERQIFEMLPKLKGDSRDQLVQLLLAQGAEAHALAQVASRSAVRRCRGAFALGMLGLRVHLDRVVALLDDPSFLVRRVAVRALGNMGDPRAVRPLLVLGERDTRLTRDLTYALDRLGPEAAPELRAVLAQELRSGEHLHLDPAAAVLGLIGDREAVEVLTEGLVSANPSFAGACAEALGRIGAPESIPALVEALLDPRPNVRAGAAHALGSIGSSVAVDSLADVVDEQEPQVSRQAARALLELGPGGRAMLEASSSPYAVEALALDAIRGARG